jgi:hypothetical protein
MPSDFDLMRQLFTLLEGNIFFGDRLSEREFVALVNPGQFISDQLDPANGPDAYTIWKLTNKVLAASFLYKPLLRTVSGTYEDILKKAALPETPLTPDQEELLKQTRAKILQEEPTYSSKRRMYRSADRALSAARERHAPDSEIVVLMDLRDQAMDDWVNYGYKDDYERLKGIEWDLTAIDPKRDWAANQREFQRFAGSSSIGDYYTTNLFPAPKAWSTAGWAKQTISIRSSYSYEYSRSTHFDAGGGASFGLWSFGGGYSEDRQWQHKQSSSSEIDITLEYLVVEIDRPWLNTDVLDARYWVWKKGQENTLLSDGGSLSANPPVAPVGAMPLLPTSWFMVRNVQISGQWSQADMNYHASQISAHANFGWGPFSAQGSFSESTSEKTATSHFQGASLVIPQPQLIAVFGTLLNFMPHYDPSLNWGSDANKDTPTYTQGVKDVIDAHLR